jgi:hypothetical protein
MAYEIPNFYVGIFPANIDMSSLQYRAVCVVTANSVSGTGVGGAGIDLPSAASVPILGVVQINPQQGEAGTVMVQGISMAQASGAFNIGDLLMSDSSGKLLLATSGNYAVAMAMEKAAIGDITSVLLKNFGKV